MEFNLIKDLIDNRKGYPQVNSIVTTATLTKSLYRCTLQKTKSSSITLPTICIPRVANVLPEPPLLLLLIWQQLAQ